MLAEGGDRRFLERMEDRGVKGWALAGERTEVRSY